MPLPQVVIKHPAEILTRTIRSAGNLQVGRRDESDDRDRSRAEGRGHGLISLGPPAVTGEQHSEQALAGVGGKLNERKAKQAGVGV